MYLLVVNDMDITYKKTYNIKLSSDEYAFILGMVNYVIAHERSGDYVDKMRCMSLELSNTHEAIMDES